MWGELIEALGGAHQIGIEGVLVHGLRFMLPAELGLTLETPLSEVNCDKGRQKNCLTRSPSRESRRQPISAEPINWDSTPPPSCENINRTNIDTCAARRLGWFLDSGIHVNA